MRRPAPSAPAPAPLAPLLLRLLVLTALLPAHTLSAAASDSSSGGTVWVTPHDSYSSSIGVLGCKVDPNRIAYWPSSVGCSNLCVQLSYADRSVYLLRVDQSQGAYDVSYDAWNYLYTGHSATKKPSSGGAVEMTYQNVDAAKCKDLLEPAGGRLPLSAANSMTYLANCLGQNDSWVADNYALYNINDAICTLGYNEKCSLDWPNANQPSCAHTLGLQVGLFSSPVYNILYPTGKEALATNGSVAINATANVPSTSTSSSDSGGSASVPRPAAGLVLLMLAMSFLCIYMPQV